MFVPAKIEYCVPIGSAVIKCRRQIELASSFYPSILSGVLFMPEQSILLGIFCGVNRIEMRSPDSAVGLLRVETEVVMNRAPEQTNRSDSRERRY